MASAPTTVARRGFGVTSRQDAWWLTPLLTLLGLSAFIIYSTWAAFQASDYFSKVNGADYLSPFYSPVLFDVEGIVSGHALFGTQPTWWPGFLPFSPAFLILWACASVGAGRNRLGPSPHSGSCRSRLSTRFASAAR